MSAKGWPWDVLDLPRAPETTAEVRRAYARKLKTIDQAKDIAGFEALRKAYEAALHRVEQKARKAAAKAASQDVAEPTEPTNLGGVDVSLDAAPTLADRAVAPEVSLANVVQPASLPDPLPIQSPEDRLRLRLGLLAEKNILMSPSAQVQAILDEAEFQSPELEPMLRHGLAQYIRSQLLWNHLNEPYLRHPGVTADLLKSLDARFGWLSDYTAFRRDFWGDAHILEAMVDAAGIDRSPPPMPNYPTNSLGRLDTRHLTYGAFFFVAYIVALRVIVEAHARSPDSALLNGLKILMFAFLIMFLLGTGTILLREGVGYLQRRTSNRVVVFLGLMCFGIFFIGMFLNRG